MTKMKKYKLNDKPCFPLKSIWTSNVFSVKITILIILFSSVGLITHNVVAQENSELIPSWIKFTAEIWAEDQISDPEFLNAIQWLVNNDLIQIEQPRHYSLVIEMHGIEDPTFLMNTEIISLKISHLQEILKDENFKRQLVDENKKLERMDENSRNDFIKQKEVEWISTPKKELTPFMNSKINNPLSDMLREKLTFYNEIYGTLEFGEFIVTNAYGGNFAVTTRADNYDQSPENWWQITKREGIVVRPPSLDESADIISADINIRIEDENGKFLGVLNAATRPQ